MNISLTVAFLNALLLCQAADYSRETHPNFERDREAAISQVLGTSDLFNTIARKNKPFSAIFSVNTEAASNVPQEIWYRYTEDGMIDWPKLIKDIVEAPEGADGSLLQFLKEHWPKKDSGYESGFYIQARNILDCWLSTPDKDDYYPYLLPYIPEERKIFKALQICGLLDELSNCPVDAYFYEDVETLKSMEIAEPSPFFIKQMFQDGQQGVLDKVDEIFGVIPGHAVDAGIAFLQIQRCKKEDVPELLYGLPMYIDDRMEAAMLSSFSNSEIVSMQLTFNYKYLFKFSERALDLILNHNVLGGNVDISALLEENFDGPLVEETISRIGESGPLFVTFYALASAASDDTVLRLSQRVEFYQAIDVPKMAITLDRSPDLVAKLVRLRGGGSGRFLDFLKTGDGLPVVSLSKYLPHLSQSDLFEFLKYIVDTRNCTNSFNLQRLDILFPLIDWESALDHEEFKNLLQQEVFTAPFGAFLDRLLGLGAIDQVRLGNKLCKCFKREIPLKKLKLKLKAIDFYLLSKPCEEMANFAPAHAIDPESQLAKRIQNLMIIKVCPEAAPHL